MPQVGDDLPELRLCLPPARRHRLQTIQLELAKLGTSLLASEISLLDFQVVSLSSHFVGRSLLLASFTKYTNFKFLTQAKFQAKVI